MDEKQMLLEAWKQTIATQMHFNEIAMKLRAFALTLVAAVLTAEGLSNGKMGYFALLALFVVWLAFYLMDRWWYHYLLLGAVLHGSALETRAQELGFTLPRGPTPPNGGQHPKSMSPLEVSPQGGEAPTLSSTPNTGNSLLGLTQRISELNQEGLRLKAKYKLDIYYGLVLAALLVIFLVRWFS